MRLLVAVRPDQPDPDDFFWCTPGELLELGHLCSHKEARRLCGCGRSFVGLDSRKATTTAAVLPSSITTEELAARIQESWDAAGFSPLRQSAMGMAQEVEVAALQFEPGEIIRRDDNVLKGERADRKGENHMRAEMPRYRCHKQVWALKIAALQIHKDRSATITPADNAFHSWTTVPGWADRFKGSEDDPGYFVRYEDGYASWSPTAAFEAGYTLVTAAENCENCRYWQSDKARLAMSNAVSVPADEVLGFCRRQAPEATTPGWGRSHRNDWCGDWEPARGENNWT